jgi:diacylglycerol kinase (ATP)
MEVILLHNETAGDEEWSRKDLIRLVRRAGYEPTYFEIEDALKKPEVLNEGRLVVVAGGDGSICKVALKLIGRGIPLAPLPVGTANNIARSLGLDGKPEKIARGWAKPQRHKFDVGLAKGPWGRRFFLEGLGLGLLSRSIAVLNDLDKSAAHSPKKKRDRLFRDHCVIAAIAHEMQPLPLRVTLDGRDASDDYLLFEALNIRRSGPGLDLAPQASPSDGLLDVVTATASERAKLVGLMKDRLARKDRVRRLTTRATRRLRLVTPACHLRVDDQTFTMSSGDVVEISVDRGALEFVLPGK